ncbi:MAG: hypothetical protein JG762_424 [Deferribacteraceae bacterium]|nr:hypothetical protein [Deferribacteraceae bacterium]
MIFDYSPEYTYPLYRPPSEAYSLIFQITEGCSYNKCTFCGMYVDKHFSLKSFDKFKLEVDRMPINYRHAVKRIFLADGDAVAYPTEGLIRILDYLNENFPNIERISSYAGAHALLKKKIGEWEELRKRKLTLLYFGLESGNDEVLTLMNKGMKSQKVKKKILELQGIGYDFSVMVILGAGGKLLSDVHAKDTALWINDVNPKYLGMLTLFIRRKKDYFEKIMTPTIGDLIEESKRILDGIETKGVIFRSNHISNFVTLKGVLSEDKEKLIAQIEQTLDYLKSKGLYNRYPDYYREEF